VPTISAVFVVSTHIVRIVVVVVVVVVRVVVLHIIYASLSLQPLLLLAVVGT
jgi:hypothetical protein